MNHEQAHDHLEEFVAGTLSAEDQAAVSAHLDTGCEECLRRVRELSEISALLADAAPPAEPPPGLRKRLMEQARGSDKSNGVSGGGFVRWLPALIAAAAVVLVVLWSWDLRSANQQLQSQLDSTRVALSDLEKDIAAYEDATFLLGEPGMQFIDLAGVAPNEQAFGKVVLDPDKGTGIVYMYALPPTPEGMAYQLWVVREGKPTSAGTFTVNEDGTAMLKLERVDDLSEVLAFNVTIEPEGGASEPTGMMYLTGPDVIQSPDNSGSE